MKSTPKPVMEPIAPETFAKLQAIREQIDEYKKKISELEDEAYQLVPKHTFDECKAMECEHTCHNRWDCHCNCVRRKHFKGCFKDYYSPKKKVFKPNVTYPTLGWKTTVCRGDYWQNAWHPHKVVKEHDKILVLDDESWLLKSTIFQIEDCTYIRERFNNTIYFCADDPESLEMYKILLEVDAKERYEKVYADVRKMLHEPPDYTLPWEHNDEKIFNPIK